jgi:hypothetical protein
VSCGRGDLPATPRSSLTALTAHRVLRRGLDLSPAHRRLFIRAYLSLAVADLGLRIFGFKRLLERAARHVAAQPRVADRSDLRRAQQYARWIGAAARYHCVRARCLHQSIVLHAWLTGEGLPSDLVIGVRKVDGGLLAHAWVEVDGCSVNQQPAALAAFERLAVVGGARSISDHVLRSLSTGGGRQPNSSA